MLQFWWAHYHKASARTALEYFIEEYVAQKYLFYALSIVGQDIGGYVGNLVGENLVNISR